MEYVSFATLDFFSRTRRRWGFEGRLTSDASHHPSRTSRRLPQPADERKTHERDEPLCRQAGGCFVEDVGDRFLLEYLFVGDEGGRGQLLEGELSLLGFGSQGEKVRERTCCGS